MGRQEDGDLRILHITDTWTDGLFLVPSTWRSMLWKYYITDTVCTLILGL